MQVAGVPAKHHPDNSRGGGHECIPRVAISEENGTGLALVNR